MTSTDDILKKYSAKIETRMKGFDQKATEGFSQSYEKFRSSMMPEFSGYERWCKSLGNFFTMKVSTKDQEQLTKQINIAHLNVTPGEVVVFATMIMLLTLFGGILLTVAIWLITGTLSLMLTLLTLILSIFLFYYYTKAPERLAMMWRLKASSQMVPAILYIVIYMKHTSNFEKAVAFAAEHLQAPLSTDFRKIFWDVEVGKYSTLKDSVDHYLQGWRDYSIEFVEAFHLIESSLYEPDEARRVAVLEKSLQVILDGVYDKMLKYTHDVKSPLTNVYMLGIVLPTLALAILPLASTMMGGSIKWYHVMLLFNVIIPFLVVYLTQGVMVTRPGGYGESELLEQNPLYPTYLSTTPYWKGFFLALPFFLLGIIPLLMRYTPLPLWLGLQRDYTWSSLGLEILGDSGIFGIIEQGGKLFGPFGVLSMILSLFIPLSLALFFMTAYNGKTKEIITSRNNYRDVETEFTSSLFQLGNRIGDGVPAEIAFARVTESTRGTATEGFFRLVNENIQRLGMSLERALFDPRRGAVIFYPSQLVATSMRVLVESVKKGLQVAARSLMSISEYVKNIKKINDRLNDLLAEIVSDMKSNMTFLAPLLSGIIIGLAGMITTILSMLAVGLQNGEFGDNSVLGEGGVTGLLGMFDVTQMLPTYWLQIVVGLYLVQVVFILTTTLVTINSGRDPLQETYEKARNLKKTITLYFFIALLSILGLTLIAGLALPSFT